MMHKPIQFESLSLSFPHKICFADFSGHISCGSRIAIIGRNGSGKSTLLQLFAGMNTLIEGDIYFPKELHIGYVPQIIDVFDSFSGGQRFNKLLTQALTPAPGILMLDEPTNHLDRTNRRSLIRMLSAFEGTLMMVTHDVELLRSTVDTFWHIEEKRIHIFSGSYEDYRKEKNIQRIALENELIDLTRQKKQIHADLMKEQKRAKSSRIRGEKHIQQRKWPTIISESKARNAQETSGRKKSAMNHKKQEVTKRLSALHLEEIILPKFVLNTAETNQTLVTVREGTVGYDGHHSILHDLNFTIKARERIALQGDNGSGKSTLIKALIKDESIIKTGEWITPNSEAIGYLDQHYSTLAAEKTVYDTLGCLLTNRSYTEIRNYLNDFLFRKNEEVDALVATLSGGEKARLSLAKIAAITPKLLILDEITNNLDMETRNHVIQVLKDYPGAMIVISHDSDFFNDIGVTAWYEIKDGSLR